MNLMRWMVLPMLGFLLLSGCQNSVNTVENADKSAQPSFIADKRYVTDGFLRDRLKLRSVILTPGPTGIMTVQVTATNVRTGVLDQAWSGLTGENPYSVDYKFTWQNAAGMTVDSPLYGWRTQVIHPGESVSFQSVAPSPDCKDFMLNLRESK